MRVNEYGLIIIEQSSSENVLTPRGYKETTHKNMGGFFMPIPLSRSMKDE